MTTATVPILTNRTEALARGPFYLLLCVPLAIFLAFCSSPDVTAKVLIAGSLVAPALLLAAMRSSYLLDYFLVVVVFNREMRRVMDWMAGEYDPQPLTSVTPMAIACLMLTVALMHFASWPRAVRRGALLIGAGIAYSFSLGLFKYKLAAVYGLMDYLLPLSVLCLCVSLRPTEKTITRWLRTIVTLGMVAAMYGVIQWAIVPPWDKQWVLWSGISSMGNPEPFKIGIASTLESRGPAAWFIANAAVIMIVSSNWRTPWGTVGTAFVCGVLLLTTVRSSWGFVVGTVLLFTMLRRGRSAKQLWVLGATVTAIVLCIPFLPESESIQNRVATFSRMQDDGSLNTRLRIAQMGTMAVLKQPQGFGMGSSGNGARLVEGGTDGIGDNGYLSLLTDLGIPGFVLVATGIVVIALPVWRLHRAGTAPVAATLGLAMTGAAVLFLVIFNTFTSAHASYMWIALSAAYSTLPIRTRAMHIRRPMVLARGH